MITQALEWLQPKPCLQRISLKHAWLENECINGGAAGLAVHLSDRHWREFYDRCGHFLEETDQLLESYSDEVSPASLLTKLTVFKDLPIEMRDQWAQDVHRRFLANYRIPETLDSLARARAEFGAILDDMAHVSGEADRRSSDRTRAFLEAGERMRDALGQLPKWIPPL